MMKKLHLIFAACAVLALANCSKTQHYTIQGSLGSLNAPATVYLLTRESQVKDSAVLNNGKFSISGTVDSITVMILALNTEGTGHELASEGTTIFLENGTIQVNSDNGGLRDAQITGTLNNDAKFRYHKEVEQPMQELQAAMMAKQQEAAFTGSIENDSVRAELAATEASFYDSVAQRYETFIRANPKALVSLEMVMGMMGSVPNDRVETLYNTLSTDLRQSPIGQELIAKLTRTKLFEIGAVMPEITLPDTSGTPVSSSDFKGQYLLVDLWAGWCSPCRAENPNLLAAYNEYKDRNFNVLGISLDQTREKWVSAIQEDQLPWTQISDIKYWNSAAVAHFGVSGIPANFLLDPDGKIVAKDLRGQALWVKLEELLGEGS